MTHLFAITLFPILVHFSFKAALDLDLGNMHAVNIDSNYNFSFENFIIKNNSIGLLGK